MVSGLLAYRIEPKKCGLWLSSKRTGGKDLAKFCMACGKSIKENSKFCASCGPPVAEHKMQPVKTKPKMKAAHTFNGHKNVKSMIFAGCFFLIIACGAVTGFRKFKESSYERPFELWAEGFNTRDQLLTNSAFVDECIPDSWYDINNMDDVGDGLRVKVDVLAKDDMDESEMDETLLRTMKRINADKMSYAGVKITFLDDIEGNRMTKLFVIAIARIDGKWYLTDSAL